MIFDEIIHGTQYYRAPTPLPSEWEGDISKFSKYNIDALQIRINWRWNEKREGEYDFSDVDRLMDIAEKNGRKVIMKFLLECAPQYVFDKYGGTRIGPRGEQLRGGAHGAFYGGWRPCFTNPYVQDAAVRFVEKVAERYKDRKNIILWNAWNEIRNRPIEDCFCPHCRAAFGRYLQKKFGTIEKLNDFYGVAEDSFEMIALPSMPHGFWDIYEFKKFKGGDELYAWLKFVYDAIRKYDKKRPIMAHVGFTSAFQSNISDVCDDFTVSKAVDFWGTSIPCETKMDTPDKRLDFMMLLDFLRCVDKNYFLHEIYPGLGMFRPGWYDDPYDLRFKLYTALSSGAKGMVYWQYRAERVGHEHDCAGLMRADGTARPVAKEVAYFGDSLKRDSSLFAKAEVKKADIAIVFDFDSMLMSEIEDSCGLDFHFDQRDPKLYYRKAHAGMYRLLRSLNYEVDYVSVTEPNKFKDYKVLYFPYYTMLKSEVADAITKFTEAGGTVILDEGFGLRTENTWLQPYDIACKPLINARMRERRMTVDDWIVIDREKVTVSPYITEYKVENADAILKFIDRKPALQRVCYGKGYAYLSGFSLGYSCYEDRGNPLSRVIDKIVSSAGACKQKFADFAEGVYEKRLFCGEKEIVFIFNNSGYEFKCDAERPVISLGASAIMYDEKVSIPPNDLGYYII